MTLCDYQIAELGRNGLVHPFDPALVNPCSLDVRLGPTLLIEVPWSSEMQTQCIEHTTHAEPYYLEPGEFVLAHTLEYVKVPSKYAMRFMLKSSRAREGIEHSLAGFIDAGFEGSITLELSNVRRMTSVPIWYGMRIGQFEIVELDGVPLETYGKKGHYHGDSSVQSSKGHFS
jgi:dCTP deaminase